MFFLHFPGMVEQIKSWKVDQNRPTGTIVSGGKTQNLILPNVTKWTMSKFIKEKKKTFQFSLGYLLLGFQLKTLEDFFMELFNYLYFTCQKKIKVTNIEWFVFFLFFAITIRLALVAWHTTESRTVTCSLTAVEFIWKGNNNIPYDPHLHSHHSLPFWAWIFIAHTYLFIDLFLHLFLLWPCPNLTPPVVWQYSQISFSFLMTSATLACKSQDMKGSG